MPDESLTSFPPAAGSLRPAVPRPAAGPALTRGQTIARAGLVEAVLVRRPLVLLEGGAGIGKTLVLDAACAELSLLDVPVTRLSGEGLRPGALLQHLGVTAADAASGEPGEWLQAVGEQVLAIDDALALPAETLALLAVLLRLRPDGGRVLQVLLVGGAGLLRHVGEAAPELRERAATPLGIAPMPAEEAASYLAGRLQARQATAVVPPRAARTLLQRAEGIPGRIEAELGLLLAPVPQPAAVVPAPARRLPESLQPPVGRPARGAWRARTGAVGGAAAIGFGVGLLVMGGVVWLVWPSTVPAPVPVALTPWAAPLPTSRREAAPAGGLGTPLPGVGGGAMPRVAEAPAVASGRSAASASVAPGERVRAATPWWAALPPAGPPRDTALEDELARVATATSMDRERLAVLVPPVPPDGAGVPAAPGVGSVPAPPPVGHVPPAPPVAGGPVLPDVAGVPVPPGVGSVPLPPAVASVPSTPPVASALPRAVPPGIPAPVLSSPLPPLPASPPAMVQGAPEPAAPAAQAPAVPLEQAPLVARGVPEPPVEARAMPLPPRSQFRGAVVPHQVLPGGETVEDVLMHSLGSAGPRSRALFASLNPGVRESGRLRAGTVVMLPARREGPVAMAPRRVEEPAPRVPSSRPYFCNQIRPLNAAEFAYAREVCGR